MQKKENLNMSEPEPSKMKMSDNQHNGTATGATGNSLDHSVTSRINRVREYLDMHSKADPRALPVRMFYENPEGIGTQPRQTTLADQTSSPATGGALEQIYLGVLVIQPSPFCNINCKYCYLPDRNSTKRMSMDVLRSVIEKVFESGLVGPPITLLWHAGEPLAVPVSYYEEAFEVINSIPGAKEKIIHTFQSNGTLINDKWCEFIKKHQVEIGLSIDGPAHLHNINRLTRKGEGTHAKVMEGAAKLKEHGIPFGAVAVVSDTSLDQPDEFFDFFVNSGVEGVGLNIEEVEGANAESSLEKDSTDDRVRAFMERLYQLNKQAGFPLNVREFEIARRNIFEPDMNRASNGEYYNLETTPFAMLNVDYAGNLSTFSPELLGQPTEKYESFSYADLTREGIFKATSSPHFQKVYEDVLAGNKKCAESCEYYAYCGGSSPSNKYYENGSFDSTETMQCRSVIQTPMQVVLADIESELLGNSASSASDNSTNNNNFTDEGGAIPPHPSQEKAGVSS